MRILMLTAVMLICVAAESPSTTPVCVLKHFSGLVQIRSTTGEVRAAERGALYENELLLLDRSARATLVVNEETVVLEGPLELPLCAEILQAVPTEDSESLLARLAALIPDLADSGAYISGAARAADAEAIDLLGPLGEVLGKDAVFTPVGGHASIQLKLKLIDTTEAVNLELATAQPFTIRDLAPGAYDYQFCLTLTERPGMVFSRQFTVLADDDAAGLSPDAPIDSLEAIQLAMSLLEQGLLYDAWLILAELQVEEKDVTILPLVHSLHDRVSDTLLKRGKSQKQQN